jgi:hypothetical protein
LADVLDSDLWQARVRTMAVKRSEAAYRLVLIPILRYAKSVDLVDPFLAPDLRGSDPHFRPVRLALDLLGRRPSGPVEGRVRIHVGNPGRRLLAYQLAEIEARLQEWEESIRPILRHGIGHRVTVFLWDQGFDLTRARAHDRFVLTDQCGISVPGGLDCYPSATDTTDWILLDEDIRRRRLDQYTPGIGPFSLLGSREIRR